MIAPSADGWCADWPFEVRFDYGELDEHDPAGKPEKTWFYRADAFKLPRGLRVAHLLTL